jgi:hypothetical protein
MLFRGMVDIMFAEVGFLADRRDQFDQQQLAYD